MAKKCVGIVGGGPAGLTSIKSCLEQDLEPVCFELLDNIGGSWHFTKEHVPHQGFSIYEGVTTNTSKEMTCYSDFPIPDDWPQFIPHHLFSQYFRDYGNHFDIIKYVRFKHLVTAVEPAEDYAETGRWQIRVKNLLTNIEEEMVFDFVMICSGNQRLPKMPDIPGLQSFKGEVIHAVKYRQPEVFGNKKVLIVGNSFTAGDIACEAARVSTEVYVSVGRGAWLCERTGPGNVPIDFDISSRFVLQYLPTSYTSNAFLKQLMSNMDQRKYGLGSDCFPFHEIGTFLSGEMRYMLTTGKVKIRGNLLSLSERTAKFSDGTQLDGIDIIFCATGFHHDFSYIKCQDLKGEKLLENELYKWTFPINDPHPTLAVIGLTRCVAATIPLLEMQARWASMVFNNKCKLTSKTARRQDLQARRDHARIYCAGRETIAPWSLSDEIAELIGAIPSFWGLFLRSPRAAYRFLFGPNLPAWYRIVGPDALPDGLECAQRSYWRAYNTPDYTRSDVKMISVNSSGLKYLMALVVVGTGILAVKLGHAKFQ